MPLQNRVTPTGEITAQPWRGALMGNRGILHDAGSRLGAARWRHKNWVCCVTEFRGRHRAPMPPPGSPTRYTALFFWDEVSALAAGHRPCAECRNADWRRFKAAWAAAGLPGRKAHEIDRVLHPARVTRSRQQVTFDADLATLPDGVFLTRTTEHAPLLKWCGHLWRWSPEGYADAGPGHSGTVRVLTPSPTVAAIAAGYAPEHPSELDVPSPLGGEG
ncbi:MAG: hypothetical protein IIC03_02480 [Proteobacteria bacterium]|nr:hypothetical protein [Pseudomonadota bacterium]